jgi:hypothetical protein
MLIGAHRVLEKGPRAPIPSPATFRELAVAPVGRRRARRRLGFFGPLPRRPVARVVGSAWPTNVLARTFKDHGKRIVTAEGRRAILGLVHGCSLC